MSSSRSLFQSSSQPYLSLPPPPPPPPISIPFPPPPISIPPPPPQPISPSPPPPPPPSSSSFRPRSQPQPIPNNSLNEYQQVSQELQQGLYQSTQHVMQMTSEVEQIESNLNGTLQSILSSFQTESQERRRLVDAFKTLTELLVKCQQSNTPVTPAQLEPHQSQISALTIQQEKTNQELVSQVKKLEEELAQSKQQISALQSQVNQAIERKELLLGENTQLHTINQGYKEEIDKQMSLFDRLNKALSNLRTRISSVWKSSNKAKENVTLYLPDTLLSEIRNDVIHSTTFDYLDDPTLQENDTQKTLQIVNDKWIVQIGALQRDLELIIRNLQHVDAKNESIQTWQDYIVKINEFRKIWNTKSVELVETWISTRRKRKGVSK
jgi:hypothetical protein